MTRFFADVRDTFVPRSGSADGPLSPAMVGMTVVTGLVDAFSYLALGHVFVSNVTGNIVFLGFALAGARGFSITASASALAAFLVGALIGGRVAARHSGDRGRLQSTAAAVQALFLAIAMVLAVIATSPVLAGYRYALIVVLGIAMGIQNAAVRKLAVQDLTTTVLTFTLTGITADSAAIGGSGSRAGRRLVSVVSMLAGAFIGAALVLHAEIYYPLAIALAAVLAAGIVIRQLGRSEPEWTRPQASSARRADSPRN